VPLAVIWKTCGVTNVLYWGNSSSKAKNCQKVVKIVKKLQKVVKKLTKVVKKVVKKLSKVVKRCQKIVKNCQKSDKKLTKKLSKSCQKVQNSTNRGGGWGGWAWEIVVPRPSASVLLTGRRQKNWLLRRRTTSLKDGAKVVMGGKCDLSLQ
jgi:hypothetical protein